MKKRGYGIIHACFVFIFLGNCGLFFILREGGESTSGGEEVSFGCDADVIPDIMAEEVADNRMEAFQQANAVLTQERKERELQEEHNSFHFFAEDVQQDPEEGVREVSDVEAENRIALQETRRSVASRREPTVASPSRPVERSVENETSEADYYAMMEERKQKEKKERERRLYELYYGKSMVEESDEEKEVVKEEKPADPVPAKKGFKTMGGTTAASQKGSIRAVVHGEQKNITSSSQVKLRILDPIEVEGGVIPKNTLIIGQAAFHENRVQITIENIAYNNNVYPFRGTIYDQDGFQGIYFPDNLVNDVKKEAGSETSSSADIRMGSLSGIVSTGANAIVNATKSVATGAIRETKVTLPANYKLIIKTVK